MAWALALAWALAGAAGALAAAYLYFARRFGHWAAKGVPHPRPAPFVGSFAQVVLLRQNIGLLAKGLYERYRAEPFVGLWAFDEPVLQIHDLDLVRAVLVKDFACWSDRSVSAADAAADPLPMRSLFGLRGERWKHARTALTPSFSSGKMKRMYPLVCGCASLLVAAVRKEDLVGKPVVVYELTSRYTTDVIASCAFGLQGDALAQPQAPLRRALRRHFEFSPLRALLMAAAFFAPGLLRALRLKLTHRSVEEFVRSAIGDAIRQRERQQERRDDLLDSLIQLKAKDAAPDAPTLDEEDICAHSFAFLMAGFETSASTLNYMLFELARNEAVQDKLRKEIQAVAASDGLVSYENLHSLKYLDMVMQETLRKYPPLPFVDRKSNCAYTLPGTNLTLEKGSRIVLPMYGFHMDPEYHPNPKKFDPERFSEENKRNMPNYSYMPFSEGPRNCVGMRFAQMQTKSAITHLLLKYSVHPCSSTPEEITFNPRIFLLQPKDKIQLILKQLP